MIKTRLRPLSFLAVLAGLCLSAAGQSLNIPAKTWGLSFGNSKEFTGLRFNFRDSRVSRVTGVNVTLWQPRKDNKDAAITGLSLGTLPGGGRLRGVQLGLLGVAGERDIAGVTVGGLGAGTGGSLAGINLGGLGIGAGGNVAGLNVGGLGVGCGEDLKGLSFGGLGAGAGGNAWGITVGGLGAGAGKDMIGLNIGGIGLGAGGRLSGINLAGIGAGAGDELRGVTLAGIGAGAPKVRGLVMGGWVVGGMDLKGVFLAGACVHVPRDGRLAGLAASPFNYIKGPQSGISVGIVNYAWSVTGIQLGLVNIVRDNPRSLRVLPVFNTSF